MKENVKDTTKALYTMCICLIVVMGVLFLGNSLTKGTYSASLCPGKYVDNGTNCSYYIEAYYNIDKTGENAPCTYNGKGTFLSCSETKVLNDDGEYEYRFKCVGTCYLNYDSSASTGKCYMANNRYLWSTSKPNGYSEVSGVSQSNCKGCASGYVENNEGDCVKSSTNVGKCYMANNRYLWSTSKPNGYSEVSGVSQSNCKGCASGYVEDNEGDCVKSADKYTYKFYNKDGSVPLGVKTCIVNQSAGSCITAITPPSCSGQWSYQENCPTNSVKVGPNFFANKDDSGNFYNLIGDSSFYCCDGDSTGGGGDIPGPIPNPPTTSSTSSNPPSSSTVTENPKTGSIAIFMVWVIAIGTLIYSIAYFKQSKFE